MQSFPKSLIQRFQQFKTGDFPAIASRYEELADKGQKPAYLVVSCCDSRVTPEAIFSAGPGDLFVVRNVANIVPPYLSDNSVHGVSAALEFAVLNLKVQHIIVMGHARCGGVGACLAGGAPVETEAKFISNWIGLLEDTKNRVVAENKGATAEDLQIKLEHAGVKMSLENLRSFPFIKDAEDTGDLAIHGAFFDVATGDLQVLDGTTGEFGIVAASGA